MPGRLQVPRDIDDDDALIAPYKQQELENLDSLIVEEILPPVLYNEFW